MQVGQVVADRFELVSVAGYGGMGAVFRAIDRWDDGTVAVKVIHAHDDQRRFLREAEVLAGLSHPGIVRYVDHGRIGRDGFFLAMEWLEGCDLGKRLAEGALPVEDALLLVSKIADAVGAAHAHGIVHRDLKPSNVFLEGCDATRVKILDFGIARLTHTSAVALTSPGAVIGTPSYMAPEQARGLATVDARSDVFTLGSLLFYALAGKPLYSGADPVGVITRIVLEATPSIRLTVPEVPEAVAAYLSKMLAKDPSERPADGTIVARDLEALRVVTSSVSGEDTLPNPSRETELTAMEDSAPASRPSAAPRAPSESRDLGKNAGTATREELLELLAAAEERQNRGDLENAQRACEHVLARAEQLDASEVAALALRLLGTSHLLAARIDSAVETLERAVVAFDAAGDRRGLGVAKSQLALALCRAKRPSEAEREAFDAVEMLAIAAPEERPLALGALARARLGGGRAADALRPATQALSLCEEGSRLEPSLRLTYAEALHAMGDAEGAHSAIRDARARLLARAEAVANPTTRKRFLREIPDHARTLVLADAWLSRDDEP